MCYNKSVMAKSRRSYPKSANKKIKIDFWPPNLTIYEQTTETENSRSTIKLDVKPQKPSEPTLEVNTQGKYKE